MSLILAAVGCEVFLRLRGYNGEPSSNADNVYEVADPVLDWRYVPYSQYIRGRVVSRYNSAGFRDDEHAVLRPQGTVRLVVVGDSVTEGFGVEWDSVFARIVQTHLGRGAEVINLAMRGLNAPQEVHLLRSVGLAYQPDLVVVNFVLNDCEFPSSLRAGRALNRDNDARVHVLNLPIHPGLKRKLKESAFLYFVKERVENLRGRLLDLEDRDHTTRVWSQESNRQKVLRSFDALREIRESNKIDVVILVWPLITDYGRYPYRSIHEWIVNAAHARGLATIDLLPLYSTMDARALQVAGEDNVHPNGAGHRIAAEAFLRWFEQSALHRARAQAED
jgi:lysophospholipase L1-like esterase